MPFSSFSFALRSTETLIFRFRPEIWIKLLATALLSWATAFIIGHESRFHPESRLRTRDNEQIQFFVAQRSPEVKRVHLKIESNCPFHRNNKECVIFTRVGRVALALGGFVRKSVCYTFVEWLVALAHSREIWFGSLFLFFPSPFNWEWNPDRVCSSRAHFCHKKTLLYKEAHC